jgi:hypothetical protein
MKNPINKPVSFIHSPLVKYDNIPPATATMASDRHYKDAFNAILRDPTNKKLVEAFMDVQGGKDVHVPQGRLPERLSRKLTFMASTEPGLIHFCQHINGPVTQRTWFSSAVINLNGPRACLILDGQVIIPPHEGPLDVQRIDCNANRDGRGKTLQLFMRQ